MSNIRWIEHNPNPTANTLFDLAGFTDGSLLAVGQAGTLLESRDGGGHWHRRWLGTQHELRCLKTFANGTALIGGADGLLFSTADGGQTWHRTGLDTDETLHRFCFRDSSNGWAEGSFGLSLQTVDGGQSWAATGPDTPFWIRDIHDFGDGRVTAVGDAGRRWESTDDGATWQEFVMDTPLALTRIAWNGDEGWILGERGQCFAFTQGDWYRVDLPTDRNLSDLHWFSATSGLICGNGGTLLATADGGQSWQESPLPTGINLNRLSPTGEDIWLTGEMGTTIRRSGAAGEWALISSGRLNQNWAVAEAAPGVHVTVGEDGQILRSENRADWELAAVASGAKLYDTTFVAGDDGPRGWAVGAEGALLRSDDLGKSWQTCALPHPVTLYAITFIDRLCGWVAGESGAMFRTGDGGETWHLVNLSVPGALHAVSFSDKFHGWVVGEDGLILRTEDAGNTWMQCASGIETSLHSVLFRDAQNGWAVGTKGTVLHSRDGGETWQKQPVPGKADLNRIRWSQGGMGWIVGEDANLLASPDGGETWRRFPKATQAAIKDVLLLPPEPESDHEGLLLVGSNGLIMELRW